MKKRRRLTPDVSRVNARQSIPAAFLRPFRFAADQLRNMTNPFSEYSKFDTLTISDLIFFVSLFESRSLTSTALEGAMSLSSASRTLRKLRETFDDPLFLRSSPDFVPTARAAELHPKVTALLERIRGFERPETFDPATLTRTFRIGVVDNAVGAVMADVVKAFFEAAPKASLIFSQMTDSLFDDLSSGELDCAVYPATRGLKPCFQSQLLYPIHYALCVRKGHPLVEASREKGEVTIEMLHKWRKITVTNREQNRSEIYCMDETTVLGEALQETAVTVPYFLAVPTLLNATDFTAVLPMQTARLFEERTGIVAIPIHPDPKSGRGRDAFHTRLIWHERVADEPAMQWLRGLFAAHAHWEDPKTAADERA